LYVAVGNDANLRLLKGAYHPQFPQDERRYMVQSTRYVYQALITSGSGWMDAEPEIALVQPDIYIVNEDGDKPEKRSFCQERGIEYVVLRRVPKQGLPRRESSDLRGF
jgi:glycerol-3-phosphate cytidylyltransferase-like family protein